MPDMLVKLYELPELAPEMAARQADGVDVRRAQPAEKHVILQWVKTHFGPTWVSECDVAFSRQPVSCFIAVDGKEVLGFSCYDVAAKDFFGPIGVSEAARGRSIGKVLLLACLHDMYAQGYGYAIIGGVGPAEFYAKTVGAVMIEDSAPGVYRGMLVE